MSVIGRFAFVVATFALAARVARAEDGKAACIAAAEGGQDLRSEGKLVAARELFVRCSAAACPDAIRKDCARFLAEVEVNVPSIVVTAVDPSGADVIEARASIDGVLVAKQLDGKAISLDPGRHRVRVERSTLENAPPIEVDVVVGEGEKNRRVRVVVGAANDGVPAPVRTGPNVAAFVVGGVGVALIGASLFVGFTARKEIRDLRASGCAPACDESAVDRSRRKLLVADIGLGAGAVALGVATFLFLSPRSEKAPSAAASLGARYVPSGAVLQWTAVF